MPMTPREIEIRTKWCDCQACGLARTRRRVVFGRGDAPCDVLFVGEAPTAAEEVLGLVMTGPAGRCLDQMIVLATQWAGLERILDMRFVNVVACCPRPKTQDAGDWREPTPEEAWACFQRFEAEAELAAPRRVVFLGKFAERCARKLFPRGRGFAHPAYVMKSGGWKSPAGIKFARDLSALFKEVADEKKQEAGGEANGKAQGNEARRTVRRLVRRVVPIRRGA